MPSFHWSKTPQKNSPLPFTLHIKTPTLGVTKFITVKFSSFLSPIFSLSFYLFLFKIRLSFSTEKVCNKKGCNFFVKLGPILISFRAKSLRGAASLLRISLKKGRQHREECFFFGDISKNLTEMILLSAHN